MLEDRYPSLKGNIYGENYPVDDNLMLLHNVVSVGQALSMGMLFFGNFKYKAHLVLGSWFASMIVSGLVSTGAFEVYYDGELVFSKLDKDRMPSAEEIFRVLEDTYGVETYEELGMTRPSVLAQQQARAMYRQRRGW